MPNLEEDDIEWEIERIKEKKQLRGEIHYLIKWKG